MSETMTAGFNAMGVTNNYWGICGINSSLYALYLKNSAMRARMARGAMTPSMMLAEIKTFLRMLQADGKQDILDEIEAFTRSFNGFGTFTVENYINKINDVPRLLDASQSRFPQRDLLADPQFSIGLPPDSVVYYLKRICGFDHAALTGLNSTANELILGLYRDDGNNMGIYGGLRHYVYYLNGVYYSWGKQFASIAQMNRNYGGICCKITL